MYGLHHRVHHFNSFDRVRSLPKILKKHGYRTGIVGKKHVGPELVYPFDFSQTEDTHHIMQIGRNITLMKNYVHQFLQQSAKDTRPFFLYIGFHDPHRCGHTSPEFGPFCNKFGNGEPGMGLIEDWDPKEYHPDEVKLPFFVPDTPEARADLAAQYTTIGRMDQGIGLFLKELDLAGFTEDTLVIYSSDNGIPFPSGRTNLYEPGMSEPLLISNPLNRQHWGKETDALASLIDITPTVLDWAGVPYPKYHIFERKHVHLTGKSLLPLTQSQQLSDDDNDVVYASHSFHEVTMPYASRLIRTTDFKLIHNINYQLPFPIDQDFYSSATFQGILRRTTSGEPTQWYKTLDEYYYRPEWELYNIENDPMEKTNLVYRAQYQQLLQGLKTRLSEWQNKTQDPWICAPHAKLEDSGNYPSYGVCCPLFNNKDIFKNSVGKDIVCGLPY